ncbi:hypothetical protein HY932_02195 [Candidatus Falkowbacteria bacterium]|nr:hypothetical protein [Candidatus Falkowbacteria bacterium]
MNQALAITSTATGLDATAEAATLKVTKTLPQLVGYFINILLGLLGLVLLVIVVYAGILWMTAGGNPKQVEKSRDWMINGAIGLIICALAFAISQFIINQVATLAPEAITGAQ